MEESVSVMLTNLETDTWKFSSTSVLTPDDINVLSFPQALFVENSHPFETDVDIENSHDSRSVIRETIEDSSSEIRETVESSKETTESTVCPSV